MTDRSVSPGQQLRNLVEQHRPLQVVGAVNAYAGLLARDAGFDALYLSGSGVASASFGLPDLGYTTLEQVAEDARRIAHAVPLPLLVDADTGWDDPGQTVATLSAAGAAGLHLEDQVEAKRCGHRPGKQLVDTPAMVDRLSAAVAGRADGDDPAFVLMARTDAYSVEGLDAAIARAQAYRQAGADMIFAEAMSSLDEYNTFCDALDAPVLANITEFGKTPLFTVDQLRDAGVSLALYPLSAFRAMSAAALDVYRTLREHGTQQPALGAMQTRDELYRILDYHQHEQAADRLAQPGSPK
ncbi:MAG: methylisocitrate lyase [Planctomycetota bacterium]